MRTNLMRVVAAVAVAAILAGQFATAALAKVPEATATSTTFGDFGGNGDAGFSATLQYTAKSTASKVYLNVAITGGVSVPLLSVARKGVPTDDCVVVSSPLAIRCLFKLVRAGDTLSVVYAVRPQTDVAAVSADAEWSTTGYVSGGNNSHGDAWQDGVRTAKRNPSPNFAGGFGNRVLSTSGVPGAGNPQVASLLDLPEGRYASIDDDGYARGSGHHPDEGSYAYHRSFHPGIVTVESDSDASPTGTDYPLIVIRVNDGTPAPFRVQIKYPDGPKPVSFVHVSDGYEDAEYFRCVHGQPLVNCFTFDKATKTATIYLLHNGSLRRTS